MEKLTELEKEILIDITKDNFYEQELESVIWTDCFLSDISMDSKIARGVLASLVKKGYIYVSSGKDSTIRLEDKGKEYLSKGGKTIMYVIQVDWKAINSVEDIGVKAYYKDLTKFINYTSKIEEACRFYSKEDATDFAEQVIFGKNFEIIEI